MPENNVNPKDSRKGAEPEIPVDNIVSRDDLLNRIKNYLATGGLFNPEMMEHEKVRDLIIDCRDFIEKNG